MGRMMGISEGTGKAPVFGWRGLLVNAAGILLAFGAVFGGMLLVRECLLRETETLLQGSGKVSVPAAQIALEAVPSQEAEAAEAERERLTEEELFLAVEGFWGTEELYPHEPRQGQMTMAQALDSGRGWLEEFFLPHLGLQETVLQEYRVNCYLWTRQGWQDPLLSYWTVSLSGQTLDAALVLNAVSGQVLSASVTVYPPVEYQERDSLAALLEDYADSLGMESDDPLVDERNGDMYRSIGADGMYAALRTVNIAVSTSDIDWMEYREVLNIQVYLDNWSRW